MEAGKKKCSNKQKPSSSISIVDELFGRKEMEGKSSSSSSPPAGAGAEETHGYFTTIFPHPNHVAASDASRSESNQCWTPNSHRVTDGKTKGSNSKKQGAYSNTKDGKTTCNYSTESSYFGSSVHYGARDFYATSPSKHASQPPKTHNNDENDDSIATRGDWWQGSLYY